MLIQSIYIKLYSVRVSVLAKDLQCIERLIMGPLGKGQLGGPLPVIKH